MIHDVPKKIVFLDRDGVINKKAAEHEYITKVEDFVFNTHIFDILRILKEKGFESIVVTNQRGIARGLMTEKSLAEIHAYMIESMEKEGVPVLDVFYCPHESGVCECRKPKLGLFIEATKKYRIDIGASIFITDSEKEIGMGYAFGLYKEFLIPSDQPEVLHDILKTEL